MVLNSSGLQFLSPLYQGTYQRKVYFSTNGTINHYPSWTTFTTQQNSTGDITYDTSSFFNFDNTNFNFHKITFQGYVSGSVGGGGGIVFFKPHLRIQLLNNGVLDTNPLECSMLRTNRPNTTFQALDMTNPASNNYCTIMENIETNLTSSTAFDFQGTIILPKTFGNANEIQVDGNYTQSSVGSTRSFGSFRTQVSTQYNGIRFFFSQMGSYPYQINLRFYIESY